MFHAAGAARCPASSLATVFLLLALLASAVSSAHAQSYPPDYGSGGTYDGASIMAPYYGPLRPLSGTNCSAAGAAFVNNPDTTRSRITAAQLYINGEPTKFFQYVRPYPQADDGVKSVVVSCAFDSTHFADGSTITVKLVAYLNDGTTATGEGTLGNVYNKYSIRVDREFEGLHPALNDIKSSLQAMKHTGSASLGFTSKQFRDDTLVATAVHFSAHGLVDQIFADLPNQGQTTPNPVYEFGIDDLMGQRGSSMPPIHIIFAASCRTAKTERFPSSYSINENSINKAYVGFDGDDGIIGIQKASKLFWKMLSGGSTVGDTISDVRQAYHSGQNPRYPEYKDRIAVSVVRHGDPEAKLHGVYGGAGLQWFK